MNYPAASSWVSNTLTKRVRSKLLAMNPKRFKVGRLGGQVNGPLALPAPTRVSPAPTTEQKQHYNNDQ
jgi:hypothetical protein